ncbi:MAG TPA: hypothetical protein VNC50_06620 [Planctomycetia bacterium]|nr:hypothetical protein [Planctomycetia bacterium]
MTAASRKTAPPEDEAAPDTLPINYAETLTAAVAQRAARFQKTGAEAPAVERWCKALVAPKSLEKLLAGLHDEAREALAAFRRCPLLRWRWDHAIRLTTALGARQPYFALQGLLAEGLLLMERRSGNVDPLARFDVAEGTPIEALPYVRLAPPLEKTPAEKFGKLAPTLESVKPTGYWRHADGWDLPLRLGVLWRLAWRSPVKRTQQRTLFKRDQERIANGPLLNAPAVDAPAGLLDAGMLTYAIAMAQGWLDPRADEQRPTEPLRNLWPATLAELQLSCAGAIIGAEAWNELGPETPPGSFASEMASARFLLLLALASLPPEEGASVDQLANLLLGCHPPFNAAGELVGPFRQKDQRTRLAREWARMAVLGAFYQCGMIEVAEATARGELVVRLSALGRRFLGEAPDASDVRPAPPVQTLLAQPNHQLIVYRQGLTAPLLADLMMFAEPTGLGPALTFEIKSESIYLALEAGFSDRDVIGLLEKHGGREPPTGVAESIKTWSQKRDRLSVFGDATLFEFDSKEDLAEALARGVEGTPVSDRLLLVAGEPSFSHLKISAQRDYLRSSAEPCVTPGPDGVTLNVDLSKSDLMLESELQRFAEPADDRTPRQSYRVTPESVRIATEQGLGADILEDWFARRTAGPPPASVRLLLRAAPGLSLGARTRIVVETEEAHLADGLLQHPETSEYFVGRLGPTSLAVLPEKWDEIAAACRKLGVSLRGGPGT